MVAKPTKRTTAPIPIYSQATLLVNLPLKICVVKPKRTYMADDKDSDQIIGYNGQNEKLKASSPKTKLRIKLCTKVAASILSSILIDQSACKIKGKLIKETANPFHTNNKLNAKITLYIKKAAKRVNKKLAVDAALYKGMVRKLATLNTFCAKSNK